MSNDLSLWGGARRDVWNYLLRYARENNGLSPSFREIVANVPGISSTSGASHHLDVLESFGLIEKLVGKSRGVIIVDSKWAYTGAYPEVRGG